MLREKYLVQHRWNAILTMYRIKTKYFGYLKTCLNKSVKSRTIVAIILENRRFILK